jgi:hypothetical protein
MGVFYLSTTSEIMKQAAAMEEASYPEFRIRLNYSDVYIILHEMNTISMFGRSSTLLQPNPATFQLEV